MIEVLKQALEALTINSDRVTEIGKQREAITSLRQAIKELESQERNFCSRCGKRTKDIHTCTPPQRTESKVCCQQYDTCLEPCTPRGRHLAQRTWVGLTDEERNEIANVTFGQEGALTLYVEAIEAKLKEKNCVG